MARQIVIVCIALLALQGSHATFPDLASILQKQIDGARNLTQKIITDVEETIDHLREKVETAVQNEVAKVEAAVQGFAQKVIDKVEAIKQKAETEGKAVADCVTAVPDKVHDSAKQVVQEVVACVTDPIKEARTIIENLVNLAQEANQTFSSVQTSISACENKGALEAALCKLTVLGNVSVQLTAISTQIATQVARAVSLVSGLTTNFSACEVQAWTNAPLQAATIISDVKQCLHDAVTA